jgi:hypothetical protein
MLFMLLTAVNIWLAMIWLISTNAIQDPLRQLSPHARRISSSSPLPSPSSPYTTLSHTLPERHAPPHSHHCRRRRKLHHDAWFTYAREHDYRLPDEFDQVRDALAPFWGVPPAVLPVE